MMAGLARIAILFETAQEFQVLKRHIGRLSEWDLAYEITMASAINAPKRLAQWIADREREGVEVFVVAAGGSATLAGAVASLTDHPVVGVPLDTTHFRGQDAFQAMAELPAGFPVGVMGINNVENAFYYALRIVALRHPDYGSLLQRLKMELQHKDSSCLENLVDQYPEIFSGRPEGGGETTDLHEPSSGSEGNQSETASAESTSAKPKRRGAKRLIVNVDQPDPMKIEEAADILLGGGIVAIPTDTVYGLAALATNAEAVGRLYEIKRREADKPIPLLIDSLRGLPHLVREVPKPIESLLETLWPGALTLIFRKRAGSFKAVSSTDTIGLRMPDHYVTLAVISTVARPLAVTSANLSGEPPMLTADEVMEKFADSIDCVVDVGRTPGEKVSTVLSVAESPFRILREGEVSAERLKEALGDRLAAD